MAEHAGVLEVQQGAVAFPSPADAGALARTPDWAKPIVEASLLLGEG